jgi:hypothetical protein
MVVIAFIRWQALLRGLIRDDSGTSLYVSVHYMPVHRMYYGTLSGATSCTTVQCPAPLSVPRYIVRRHFLHTFFPRIFRAAAPPAPDPALSSTFPSKLSLSPTPCTESLSTRIFRAAAPMS